VTGAASRLSLRKRVLFAMASAVLAAVFALLTLLGTDLYLHRKFERSAGLNAWGYRGPVAARKAPGEFRVAVLGGSTAFGYGVMWNESFPAVLERKLAARAPGAYTVINLGYNNEGAYSFTFTMKDFAYLNYDLVLLYEGYNDLSSDSGRPNRFMFRHESAIFRRTGYLPIFPLVFKEKAAVMLHAGDGGRDPSKTVFRPGLATKTSAQILTAAANIGQSLERQLAERQPGAPSNDVDTAGTGCNYPWRGYCRSMFDAVTYARSQDKQVIVVTQPYAAGDELRPRHRQQQSELAAMLARRFPNDPEVQYVNLGATLDVADPEVSFDRMHLTPAANVKLAEELVAPVMTLASRRSTTGRFKH
jgi:hypothetical protein